MSTAAAIRRIQSVPITGDAATVITALADYADSVSAAEALGFSRRAALTQRVRAVEKAVGISLFDRETTASTWAPRWKDAVAAAVLMRCADIAEAHRRSRQAAYRVN
jgi:DNA-binding transcriptional LysR family regulator